MATEPYKFYYFPLYVRGEPIRMMLTHAGANWEDREISFDKWPQLKPSMPNGQLPCLELKDGTKMGESYAIGRFIGALHGYYPTDPALAYEVDSLLEVYESLLSVIYKPHFAKPGEQAELLANIFDKALPRFLSVVEPLCS